MEWLWNVVKCYDLRFKIHHCEMKSNPDVSLSPHHCNSLQKSDLSSFLSNSRWISLLWSYLISAYCCKIFCYVIFYTQTSTLHRHSNNIYWHNFITIGTTCNGGYWNKQHCLTKRNVQSTYVVASMSLHYLVYFSVHHCISYTQPILCK